MIKEFTQQEVELLHWIFERELKPPFMKCDVGEDGDCSYHNQNDEPIGWLFLDNTFAVDDQHLINIEYKSCDAFEFRRDTRDCWWSIEKYLSSWIESQINVKLKNIY